MSRHWVTSDLHLGYTNIIEYCERPFNSVEEMDHVLITNWNRIVKPDDIVYYVGDFNFRYKGGKTTQEYEKELNGRIIFLKGNHDKNNGLKLKARSMQIEYGGKVFNLIHSIKDVDFSCTLNLVGHSHEKFRLRFLSWREHAAFALNIGVDQWDFRPVAMEEVLKYFSRLKVNDFWRDQWQNNSQCTGVMKIGTKKNHTCPNDEL